MNRRTLNRALRIADRALLVIVSLSLALSITLAVIDTDWILATAWIIATTWFLLYFAADRRATRLTRQNDQLWSDYLDIATHYVNLRETRRKERD